MDLTVSFHSLPSRLHINPGIFHGYNKFVANVIYVRKVIRLCLAKSFLGDLKRKILKYLYQKEFVMPEIKLNPIIEEKKK